MAAGGTAKLLVALGLPLLQRLPAEAAHELGLRGLHLLQRWWPPVESGRVPGVDLLGLHFAHPVGLAAGFDKNGDHVDALGALGFSHIEVGTVTPRPQAGNPRPRLFRLRGARALINRMGFNNLGAEHVADNLQRASWRGIRGVSIGKNADTPLERAADDYIACLRRLYTVTDYFAINVSSPNTLGLRALQAAPALAGIVEPLQQERARLEALHGRRVPLLVKISPDLGPGELRELCAALLRHSLDGVIATNSSTDLPGYEAELRARQGGGLSGAPLNGKSLEVLRLLRRELGAKFPIIGVGGLMSAAAVQERLAAGASLVQLYTGFVYRGPALLWEILRSLAQPRQP
jgi:dihydroorotate dehydrogenase